MQSNLFREAKFEYEGSRFKLEYCLTQDADSLDGQELYGVRVRMKKTLPIGQIITECKQIMPVFRSRKTAEELAEMLSVNEVFPVTLYDVVTEYLIGKIRVQDVI